MAIVLLDLTLTPNRSLSRDHARWVVLAVGGVFLLASIRFLVLGLWPIIPFMIADVVLLAWALRTSFRSGGGHERLVLADNALTLTRVSALGEARVDRLEPWYTRVHIEETPLGDAHLFLAAHGRRLLVGHFLSAPERRAVGAVITDALARYRGSSPSTSAMA